MRESSKAIYTGGAASSWVTSTLVHIVLLVMFALVVRESPDVHTAALHLRLPTATSAMEQELIDFETLAFETPSMEAESIEDEIDLALDAVKIPPADSIPEIDLLLASVQPMTAWVDAIDGDDLTRELPTNLSRSHALGAGPSEGNTQASVEVSLADRELGGRAARRIKFASPQAKYAIDRGLFWLARHQLADGGWGFDHRVGQCQGRCGNPGSLRDARVAATGLALLPFLGSGHTPETGEYRQRVAAGINFLIANTGSNGSLWRAQGEMYGHGIATLALCECYGMMTQASDNADASATATVQTYPYGVQISADEQEAVDEPSRSVQHVGPRSGGKTVDIEQLRRAAKAAVYFISRAQSADGGWRYKPRERGDTSVVGWQIMAMKSAADAGLGTNQQALAAASAFLNSVQRDLVGDPSCGLVGTRYAYQPSRNKITEATSAIGLTCRVCMGTSPNHPAVQTAVQRIVTLGPLGGDMYYNYYANQVVFQHGGAEWDLWNQQLSEALARSQNHQGHLDGSWYFGAADRGATAGGRLYVTAMACLCLEESFRHLPMFRNPADLQLAGMAEGIEPESAVGEPE